MKVAKLPSDSLKALLPIYVVLNTIWILARNVEPRQSDFYDDIIRRNFTAKRVDYTHRHSDRNTSYEKRRSHTKSKLDIAGEAFNHVAGAAYVVESAKVA